MLRKTAFFLTQEEADRHLANLKLSGHKDCVIVVSKNAEDLAHGAGALARINGYNVNWTERTEP